MEDVRDGPGKRGSSGQSVTDLPERNAPAGAEPEDTIMAEQLAEATGKPYWEFFTANRAARDQVDDVESVAQAGRPATDLLERSASVGAEP